MNKKIRRMAAIQAVCLAVIAAAGQAPLAAAFVDAEGHWAKTAIDVWSGRGVITGHDGLFRPDDSVTRGELAVMLNRIMGYTQSAENVYSDLDDSWYTEAVLKLAASGIMEGHDGMIRPGDSITREEAAVMITRAFEIAGESAETDFDDASETSDWAAEAVGTLASNGYINGFEDNTFRPRSSMSRAEFVTVINNAVKGFYTKPGTYTSDGKIEGIVIVNSGGVILDGMEIDGDLIIAPGTDKGTVTLKNTVVSGNIINQGGTVNEDGDGSGETPEGTSAPESTSAPQASPSPTTSPSARPTMVPGGAAPGAPSAVTADESSIIVDPAYEGKTGSVTVGGYKYTVGKNAFSDVKAAVEKANSLGKAANIKLLADAEADETIIITAGNITLDGGGRTVKFAPGVKDGIQAVNAEDTVIRRLSVRMNDETGKWNGSYGIQIYGGNALIDDVSASGGDAALLVNGSEVTLDGNIDVSGNEFGGIEVSKGGSIETAPLLKGTAVLKNDTESAANPTVWIDKASELTDSVVAVEGLEKVGNHDRDQTFFFVNGIPESMTAQVSTPEELKAAFADPEVRVITVTGEIAPESKLEITRSVSVKGSGASKASGAVLKFDNSDGIEIVNAGKVTLENISVEIINNEEGWQGLYGIQAYGASEVTLSDVSVAGGDAALLVNGSKVLLAGGVDVSGNEFGGIEVSRGTGLETKPLLTGAAANIENASESISAPTIWIDKVSELTADVVAVDGMYQLEKTERDQLYFFINEQTSGGTDEDTEEKEENGTGGPEQAKDNA